jgi:septal ring factor EnvC (AmiA/AmiB activator)
MLISQAKNLSIDPDVIKIMVGKSVNKAMLPYLTGIDVKTAFLKLQKVLGIATIIEESETNVKRIEQLENALVELEKENKNLKTRMEVLQSKLESHETTITDLNERLTYFEKHGKKKSSFVFR